jgi:hypothetical protein
MYLDVLGNSENVFALDRVSEIKCFADYNKNPESSLDKNSVMKYVILLYSKDSVLNRKPMPPLSERRERAATLSGLDPDDRSVNEMVFDLLSEQIRDLILGYLIQQSQMIWTERCIVEAQIQENQKIRFKPIQNKVVTPKTRKRKASEGGEEDESSQNSGDDDAYIINASNKKYDLTDHFDKYYELLKKYDSEIFADHENVKEVAMKRERNSLEMMANE